MSKELLVVTLENGKTALLPEGYDKEDVACWAKVEGSQIESVKPYVRETNEK